MSFVHHFLLIFLPLFVAIDPAGTLPVFLGLTSQYTPQQRRHVAIRATIVAAVTGILFVVLGQYVFSFLGVRFADFQIAGGILLAILSIVDLLSPGKPAVNDTLAADPADEIGAVPLGVPLMVGPATMTTSLLLLNTYAKGYNEWLGAPYGQIVVTVMVCGALLLNLLILFTAMWYSSVLVRFFGKNAMVVMNKIVMILLAAIAVSLIRQGVVSIVADLRTGTMPLH